MPATTSLESLCKNYLTRLREQRNLDNNSPEMSYREYLGGFLRESADALGKHVSFTHEAKVLAVGRPDYAVTEGLKEIGFVETESITADLSKLKSHAKEQNDRFKQNLHALLLTNHLEFELWVDNVLVETARFSSPPAHGPVKVSAASVEEWEKLIGRFLNESVPPAKSAEDVAKQLAKRAGELKFAAATLLAEEDNVLAPFFNAYKQTLYAHLTPDQFADVYAQTFPLLGFDAPTLA